MDTQPETLTTSAVGGPQKPPSKPIEWSNVRNQVLGYGSPIAGGYIAYHLSKKAKYSSGKIIFITLLGTVGGFIGGMVINCKIFKECPFSGSM